MSSDVTGLHPRCAHHPSRPAVDDCPVCGRARCDADAAEYGARGCVVCQATQRPGRAVSLAEVVVRAGLASVPVAAFGGWIATQYVNDHIFSLAVPGLVGFACALAAAVVNSRRDRPALLALMAIAAAAGVLGTALGFHLVPGGRQSIFRPANVVVAPYLCAIAGVVAWWALFGTARRARDG